MRQSAIEVLIKAYPEDGETKTFLQSAITHESWRVRQSAIEGLVKAYPEDEETKTFLQSAITDESWRVRQSAIEGLVKAYPEDTTLWELFSNCAINDPFKHSDEWETNPRQTALNALLKLDANHPQLPEILRERLENDADEKVREFARQALDKIGFIPPNPPFKGGVRVDSFLLYDVIPANAGIQRNSRLLYFI